jgi:magnesium transporter
MSMRSKIRSQSARKARFRRRTGPGAPPGVLVPDETQPAGRIHIMAYGPQGCVEQQVTRAEEVAPFLATWPVTWINVDGLGDVALMRDLGRLFHLHNLALEDVIHVHQRAKVEAYGDHFFLVTRMPDVGRPWRTEQVSLFFGERFVLTFQEQPGGDCLEPVRLRIRAGLSGARAARPDYLVYAILDAIVDHYFPLLEECGERLDALEEEVSDTRLGPARRVMGRVQTIKRDLQSVRRVLWPLRDAINVLLRDATALISEETRLYLRDVHDHTIQIVDLVDQYRDISTGVAEIHLAAVSQRTNDIVKVLTILSAVFIPLTFIAGVYGMNFAREAGRWSMPELYWEWGYPAVLGVMAATAAGMLLFFLRKGWLRRAGE